jgi:hypothetical protein
VIVPIVLLLKPESNVLDVPIGLLFVVPVNVKFDASTVVALDVDHPDRRLLDGPPHAKLPNVSLSVATLLSVYIKLCDETETLPAALPSYVTLPSVTPLTVTLPLLE